jgi:hypothetical protein
MEDLAMRKSWLSVILAVSVASLLFISVAAAADQQIIKVGKKGEVMFDQETKIGDITLKPGHYQIQHRVEGSDHLVHFTEFKGMHQRFQSWGSPSGLAHPGEVKCSLEPLQAKVSQTRVMLNMANEERRITRIEIAGENVAHVF